MVDGEQGRGVSARTGIAFHGQAELRQPLPYVVSQRGLAHFGRGGQANDQPQRITTRDSSVRKAE